RTAKTASADQARNALSSRLESPRGWRAEENAVVITNLQLTGETTFWQSSVQVLQQLPRNHDPLYLRRPFADFANLGVAHEAFDRVILGVAVTAMELNGGDRGAHAELGAEKLGQRGFCGERTDVLRESGGVIHQ